MTTPYALHPRSVAYSPPPLTLTQILAAGEARADHAPSHHSSFRIHHASFPLPHEFAHSVSFFKAREGRESQISDLRSQISASLNPKNHFAASIFNQNRALRSCPQRSLRLRASNSHTPRSAPWNANPPLGLNRQPPNHALFHLSSFRIYHSSFPLPHEFAHSVSFFEGREGRESQISDLRSQHP
jgi:hypothetical protein